MTPQQVEEAARRRYNAVNSSYWTQDEVFKLIYDAELTLAVEARVIENTNSSTSTVAGTQGYAFPTNCIAIKRLEYNGTKLKPVSMREDDALTLNNSVDTTQGTPQYYFEWNNTVYLRPIPDAVQTLKFYQYEMPTLLTTASTTLSVPTRCHMHLVDYVGAVMAEKDGNFSMADRMMKRWEEYVEREKRFTAKKKRTDGFAVVKDEESLAETILGSV